jgi:GH15 family glucan-1,4-alpha-glucosidase
MEIADYGLIGDTSTAALVGRDGSIDWFCAPRFDSAACFAALLGDSSNGRWLIAPVNGAAGPTTGAGGGTKSNPPNSTLRSSRRYRGDTLILDTEFETGEGAVRLTDFMVPESRTPRLVRIVEGLRGRVPMRMELVVRFEYGWRIPWVRRIGRSLEFVAGPDALRLHFSVDVEPRGFTHAAEFAVRKGEKVPFVLTWRPSYMHGNPRVDPFAALGETERWWTEWSERCTYQGPWREGVMRSLIVLKALAHHSTGGIVAAPTTSLPEAIGGVRNWDYRFCWLRDATFCLYALMMNGYTLEARRWRDWLLRAIAGQPKLMQVLYGPAGETRLPEFEMPWLAGFAGSAPVRMGNAASDQRQLDVYGEVMDAMYLAGRAGVPANPTAWGLQKHLMKALAERWPDPDEGIWEVRGPQRHFTHSKVMSWVAVDRAIKSVERLGLKGPLDEWRRLREQISREILEKGYDARRRTFTWYYGSEAPDASLLLIPLVGFLPADDERMRSTIETIRRELLVDGFLLRYRPETSPPVDGLPPGEGAFLPCTFWLADNLMLLGRTTEAREVFERLLSARNDLGLLSEEYDPRTGRMLGNFPQAMSHVSLVNTALNLSGGIGLAFQRMDGAARVAQLAGGLSPKKR